MSHFRVGKPGGAVTSYQVADSERRPVLNVIVQGDPVARFSPLHVCQDLHASRGALERR